MRNVSPSVDAALGVSSKNTADCVKIYVAKVLTVLGKDAVSDVMPSGCVAEDEPVEICDLSSDVDLA